MEQLFPVLIFILKININCEPTQKITIDTESLVF